VTSKVLLTRRIPTYHVFAVFAKALLHMPPLNPPARLIRFDNFEIDAANRELRNGGRRVRLQPKQFALLVMLAERAGQTISREEIRERIWDANTFVDFERSINFAVNQVRAALGDSADKPRYIETVPRLGYRFLPSVDVVESQTSRTPNYSDSTPLTVGDAGAEASCTQVSHSVPVPVTPSLNRAGLTAVLSALVFAVLALPAWRAHTRSMHSSQAAKGDTGIVTRTRPITPFFGGFGDPAFSPDGKQIAFTWDGPDHKEPNIYTLPIGGDQPYRVTRFGPHVEHLAWSRDGQTIVYTSCFNKVGGVYAVPALGGPESRLYSISCLGAQNGAPQYTADGKSLIVGGVCGTTAPLTSAIAILSLATGQKHCLTTPPVRNFDMFFHLSPNGTKVAFVRAPAPNVGDYYVVPVTGGQPVRLTKGEIQFRDFMWSPDSSRIIFESGRTGEFGDRLVSVSADGGAIIPESVYHDLGSLSPDGRRVVHLEDNGYEGRSIWRALLTAPGGQVMSRAKLISSLNDDSPQISPDGTRIAFSSFRSGSSEIWTADAEGKNVSRLTFFGGELAGCPRWSPDGRRIAFDRYPGTPAQVWLMDADGRNQHALISTDDDNNVPSWSRDGRSIYFASWRSGDFALWRQPLTPDHGSADGKPVQLSRFGGFSGFESYDGKTIYFTRRDADGIWSVPTDGGLETRVTSTPTQGFWGHWALTEPGLYLLDCRTKPHCAVEFYNFSSRTVSMLFQIEQEVIAGQPGLTASRDGRTVLYTEYTPGNNYIAMTEILR
jgi:Tol biopolymer transport system component/DNA-binding winged helix-turn-helix (wHTH) protein